MAIRFLHSYLIFVRGIILFLMIIICSHGAAQTLLPKPQSVRMGKGVFSTGGKRTLRVVNEAGDLARCFLAEPWIDKGDKDGKQVVILKRLAGETNEEAYRLHVSSDTLMVEADGKEAFRYALATVRQLSGSGGGIRCCDISDRPAYRWRGLMLDVSRHFRTVSFLKRQIDAMARYKLNRLHLHLTDAAGWRIEIKRYPRLTQMAAWRPDSTWQQWQQNGCRYAEEGAPGAYGGYYTQQELRELVGYAAERGITIVPEIEMPAHSEEVLAAYPELSCTHEPYRQADFCAGSVATYDFLENVLREVLDIFPSEYIHVGGDEAGKLSWGSCPLCQRMMSELHTDEDGLQAYLIRRVGNFLATQGRRLIAWDEVAAGDLPQNASVMVWRDEEWAAKAAAKGCGVVLSPGKYCYIDSYQDAPPEEPVAMGGYLPLERVYTYVPGRGMSDAERRHVLGLQANLWAEYIPSDSQMEYMLWPRALAIAETGWSGGDGKDFADFRRRAAMECEWLRRKGINAFDLRREKGERTEAAQLVSHKARGCRVKYNAPLSEKYPAGGEGALVDGLRGGWTYGDNRWQGFIGDGWPLDVTVDLGRRERLHEVGAVFMQSVGPWVYYPDELRISVSDDGVAFREVFARSWQRSADRVGFRPVVWRGSVSGRYVRMQARTSEKGGWLFTDEIVVR